MVVRRVATPEGALHVRVEGSGASTLVLAADPPNVVEQYDRLLAVASRRRRVAVFEPLGFGRSVAKRGFDHSVEAHARAVRALLDDLGPGPFALAFPCVTAYVAVAVAAAEPRRVTHVALVQAPSLAEARTWARRVDPGGLLAAPIVGRAILALGARAIARRWYRAALPRGADPEAFAGSAMAALDGGAKFPLDSAFRRLRRDGGAVLPLVAQPALVLWGTSDRSHRRTDRGSTREHAPGARFVEFEECGHFPELEAPERFVDEVERLLAS